MSIAELNIVPIFAFAKSLNGAVRCPEIFGQFFCLTRYDSGYFLFRVTGSPVEGLSRQKVPLSFFGAMLKLQRHG